MKVLPLGVKGRWVTQPLGVILTTLSPPLDGVIFWALVPYIRSYADLPASFQYLGNKREICFEGRFPQRSYGVKETPAVRFETRVLPTTPNVKVLPTELR